MNQGGTAVFSPLSHGFLFWGGKMIEKLESLKLEAIEAINNCNDETELNNVKSKYIGKKSEFSFFIRW